MKPYHEINLSTFSERWRKPKDDKFCFTSYYQYHYVTHHHFTKTLPFHISHGINCIKTLPLFYQLWHTIHSKVIEHSIVCTKHHLLLTRRAKLTSEEQNSKWLYHYITYVEILSKIRVFEKKLPNCKTKALQFGPFFFFKNSEFFKNITIGAFHQTDQGSWVYELYFRKFFVILTLIYFT